MIGSQHRISAYLLLFSVHIPAETRRKLDRKSARCIFIGYEEDQGRVYKLYNEETRKTLTSRDVVFDETTKTKINGGAGVVRETERLEENPPMTVPMNKVLSQCVSRDESRNMINHQASNRNYEDSEGTPTKKQHLHQPRRIAKHSTPSAISRTRLHSGRQQ